MDDNNVNEMKLAKFETFVSNIRNKVRNGNFDAGIVITIMCIFGVSKVNVYSKIIFSYFADYLYYYKDDKDEDFGDEDIKSDIDAINEYVRLRKKSESAIACIFGLLMSLAVDKTDYEDRLSTICDFAAMLEVTDDEMADIVQVVRFVYRDIKAKDVALKTDMCKQVFRNIVV